MRHLKAKDNFEFSGMKKELLDVIDIEVGGQQTVKLVCKEVTSLCPVTKQPDYHIVEVEYYPNGRIVESKSMKMYLNTFRQVGIMTEFLAKQICKDLFGVLEPIDVKVVVRSESRGGISIEAVEYLSK